MKTLKAKLIFAISLIVVAGALIAALIVLDKNNEEPSGVTPPSEGTTEVGGGVSLPPVDIGSMFN